MRLTKDVTRLRFLNIFCIQVILTANASLVSRGASVDSSCKAECGSGGVIVINGTINGTVPNPLLHTSPVKPGNSYVINGVVLINGKDQTLSDNLLLCGK